MKMLATLVGHYFLTFFVMVVFGLVYLFTFEGLATNYPWLAIVSIFADVFVSAFISSIVWSYMLKPSKDIAWTVIALGDLFLLGTYFASKHDIAPQSPYFFWVCGAAYSLGTLFLVFKRHQ